MARRSTTRKGSRKGSRKSQRKGSRKGSRKSQRRTQRKRGGSRRGIFGTVYSPVSHLIQAAENSVNAVTRGTSGIVRTGLGTVNKVGKSITGHADAAIRNVVSRKNRKGSRKNRRN